MFKKFFKKLGPGLITGASDDDPSGILTYLQGGVVLGLQGLWTSLFTIPLMYAVQEMSGRIGLVSGKGLIKLIKENYSAPALFFIACISLAVVIVNIGADLLATATVLNAFIPLNVNLLLILISLLILTATIFLSYKKFARILELLALSLFFYVASVFYIKINWWNALQSTIRPHLILSPDNFLLLTAIFGTTISPYLFFWQANEEVEEKEEEVRKKELKRVIVTKHELRNLKEDTISGMILSNVVMWFIILGAAQLASSGGLKEITDFHQAASVLKPLLGDFAYLAFSLGIIGTGFLAIPILAGNIGYMLAEIFNWPEGINKKFHEAKGFYLAIIAATFLGAVLNGFGFDPVRLLILTAVLYAFITPPVIYLILKIANNRKIMKERVNSGISNVLGYLIFIISLLALIVYFISLFSR